MFRRRRLEQIPELNTSSTADISFMLLIFFLVTSSMDTDKGLLRQLPPPLQEQQPPQDIRKDHVLQVTLDASDQLAVNGTLLTTQQLKEQIMEFIAADRTDHVISIRTDRDEVNQYYPQRISESKPSTGGAS